MKVMKKTIIALTLTFILANSVLLASLFPDTRAANFDPSITQYPTVYSKICIRSDGSIDPSISPIQKEGNTYTFTQSIFNTTIEIYHSNTVIDGSGFTLEGSTLSGPSLYRYSGDGVKVVGSNVTIKNINIINFAGGVLIVSGS